MTTPDPLVVRASAGSALVRPVAAIGWELRGAWAKGSRIAVSLERADISRLEGHVFRVSPTNASATIAGVLVPLDCILAVHRPSRLGDSTIADRERWRGMARAGHPIDGQLEMAM